MVGEEHRIETRIEVARGSPFFAVYARGFLYNENRSFLEFVHGESSAEGTAVGPPTRCRRHPAELGSIVGPRRDDKRVTRGTIEWWRSRRIGELRSLERDLSLSDVCVFEPIIPFSDAELRFRRRDGQQTLMQQGLALSFAIPALSNQQLVDALEGDERSHRGRSSEGVPGVRLMRAPRVFASHRFLRRLGFDPSDPPDSLLVDADEGDPEVELRLKPVESMPYVDFVVPLFDYMRSLSGEYHGKPRRITVYFVDAAAPEAIEAAFHEFRDADIGRTFRSGERLAVQVTLGDQSFSTLREILGELARSGDEFVGLETVDRRLGDDAWPFDGAIFPLNPNLITRMVATKDTLEDIETMLEGDGDFEITTGLLEAIGKIWEELARLEELKSLFSLSRLGFIVVLVLFNGMVIVARAHRFGVLRLHGASVGSLLGILCVQAVLAGVGAFALGLAAYAIMYGDVTSVGAMAGSFGAVLRDIVLASVIGMVLPATLLFATRSPAEMIAYRMV